MRSPSPLNLRLSRAEFLKLVGSVSAALAWGNLLAEELPPPPLPKRPIPRSTESLPVIGLGTWQTFDVGTRAEDRAPLREVLRLLLAAGGKVIDSSPMYGRSEAVVGDLLAELGAREEAFIATKVWTRGKRNGIEQMQTSLQRFRTQWIDLMQVHNLVDWQAHLQTLRQWKDSGTIRYAGITHYTRSSLPNLSRLIQSERIDFVQLPYSIATRDAENQLLPLAADLGVAVLVNRPYEGGSLFRAARGRTLPTIAQDLNCESWAQFFLKYILAHPAVTCVIPGTSKPKHLVDNLGGAHDPLPTLAQRQRMLAIWKDL